MIILEEKPHLTRVYDINSTHLQGRWFPTCQNLWDGRIGIISLAMSQEASDADYITMATFEGENTIIDGYKSITPCLAHWIKGSCLASSPDLWDLCVIRRSGKTTVWMECQDGSTNAVPQDIRRLCFANFPTPKRADREERKNNISDGANVWNGTDIPNLTGSPRSATDDTMNKLLRHLNLIDTTADLVTSSSTNSHEASVMDSVVGVTHLNLPLFGHDDPNVPSELVKDLPVTFGNICEYSIPQYWIQEYRGIYGLDFDDARGRLAFGMGNGEILIVEVI
jgi:hypothetical protein